MEILRGDGELLKNIDLDPANTHQEVLQNAAIILDSIRGSIPMVRGLGINGRFKDRRMNVIENEIVADIYDQFDKYEPRAIISEVRLEIDHFSGRMVPVIVLEGVKEDE